MRALVALSLVGLAGCNCSRGPVTPINAEPVRVSPSQLDFGRGFVGFPQRRSLQVTNPNRVEVPLSFAVSAPFSLPSAPTRVAGGDAVNVEVEFAPTQPGDARRLLEVNDARVLLLGDGAAVPDCDAGAACFSRTFDADAGRCVEQNLPDGLDCTFSSACFVKASCQQGECLGTLTTCDDNNPCTLEVCGATGCGHLDGLSACPEPDDPCLVPTCDPKTGCGIAPALDGTSCGPRSCTDANVCINGQCVLRPAPQNQACTDVLAGVPAGQGNFDGPPSVARFRNLVAGAYDGQGNLYVLDGCAIRKVSPSGIVRTIAGVVDECDLVNGAGLAARLNYPSAMVFDGTSLFIREWCQLRRVSLSGLVTPFVGNITCEISDGIGNQASLGYGDLAYEPSNRKLLLLDRESSASDPQDGGFWLREVSRATGEVVTLAPLKTRPPTPPNNTLAQLDTLAVTSDGGIFGCVLEAQVLNDTSYGGGNFLVQLDRDGTSHNVNEGPCLGVTAAGPNLLINYVQWIEEWTGAGQVRVAGDVSGYLDGPSASARLNFVSAVAVNDAGIAALDSQNYNLRLVRGGQVTTLAGPRPDRQVVDGPAGVSRLGWPVALAARPDGGVFFIDGAQLRQLDSAGNVAAFAGSMTYSQVGIDGPVATATFSAPMSLAISGDAVWVGEWWTKPDFSSWVSLRKVDLLAGMVSTPSQFPGGPPLLASHQGSSLSMQLAGQVWEISPLGVPTARTPDGGMYYYYGSTLAPDGADGWYLGASAMLLHANDAGVISPVINNSGSRLDGPSAVAGFGSITGLVVDAAGDVYLTDYNRVRRYRPSTDTLTTLFELSDAPLGLDVEPTGTLVVLVPNAILRLKP